jgi:ATP-dependent RNA helicase RhlE
MDLASQKALNFRQFTGLVLDEFDRLLDMGFSRDIQRIIQAMVNRRQTVLFSATEEKNQRSLIREILNQPVEVRVSAGNVAADRIDQEIVRVREGENKLEVLLAMVSEEGFQKVLVFADTKRWVKKVCQKLQQAGIKADEIHSNKSQNYRLKALNDFRNGKTRVLIATDVAARGLDITEVTHVINYQQPKNFDSYIHRIGRTGRAGKAGKAFTFID